MGWYENKKLGKMSQWRQIFERIRAKHNEMPPFPGLDTVKECPKCGNKGTFKDAFELKDQPRVVWIIPFKFFGFIGPKGPVFTPTMTVKCGKCKAFIGDYRIKEAYTNFFG